MDDVRRLLRLNLLGVAVSLILMTQLPLAGGLLVLSNALLAVEKIRILRRQANGQRPVPGDPVARQEGA